MKSLHRKMSWEEFESFPHRLGWKHEYYGGSIHLTPSKTAIVPFCLKLGPRTEAELWAVRPLTAEDERPLADLFVDAFAHAVDYVDYPRPALRESAGKSISPFFEGEPDARQRASRLVEDTGQIVAAALIASCRKGPLLQPLFVRRSHQRRGAASAEMNAVVNVLRKAGERRLYSHCHLGNEPSMAWHTRFGFQELPDAWIAAARARHFQHELQRHRSPETSSAEELETLRLAAAHWDTEWQRLHELEKIEYEAAHPLLGIL